MILPIPPALSPVRGSQILASAAAAAIGSRREAEGALETMLAVRYRAQEVAACGSGTEALQLALMIAASAYRGADRIVALPAYACFDLATAAIGSDFAVTFYDLDPETLGPDLSSVERAIDRGARVVIGAPLFGYPVEWEALETLVHRRGALLIEDAAQAAGGTLSGRLVGELGVLTVLSFGRGKGWTGGGGGALLARGNMVSRLRDAKRSRGTVAGWGGRAATIAVALWVLGRPGFYGVPAAIPGFALGETVYHPPKPIEKMVAFSLQLAARTGDASAAEAQARRTRALQLGAMLEGVTGLAMIRPVPHGVPGYLRLPVLLEGGHRSLRNPARARALGIMPGYPIALPELPALSARIVGPSDPMPIARTLAETLLTLPTHRFITGKVAERVTEALGGR